MDKLQRYSMSVDHSLERERGRRRRDRIGDYSDHYHHERSHERSKRKDIEEENEAKSRKKKKTRFENGPYSCSIVSETSSSQISEAVKRAQELAAQMGQELTETAVAHKPTTKVHVLRLDALGREIDEHGHVISSNVTIKPINISTLKVNINKHKKDAFQILKPHQVELNQEDNPHFDSRMCFIDKNKILRPKRISFQFVEQGQWTRDAENFKFKTKLIELSVKKPKEPISEYVEWWDANILVNSIISVSHVKLDKLTHYVEHPCPIEPPAEAAPPLPQPLKLTKKEQKKLRTQRRAAKEKEKQEMIRLGLLEPPKSKVKMSNLMKVLGSEGTQDPTKVEKEIRKAAAEREQAHTDRNIARKLTPGEKREKKERKLFDDPTTTVETIVSVYMIKKKISHNPKTRFKVEMNAKQNILTGCSVMTEGMSVVVVEGKSKAIKRYEKLMLRRIKWEDAEKKEEDGENKCCLVWQGSVLKPSFHRFYVQECLTQSAAKKVFMDAGVAHYWDLALNYSAD